MTGRTPGEQPLDFRPNQPERRVFVWEYLCSGACPEANSRPSLAREGRAMLLALMEDCARVPELRPATVWNSRLGPFPLSGVEVHPATSPAEEAQVFEKLASVCDSTMIIAPEFDDLLLSRSRRVLQCGGRLAGCRPGAVRLCGDKLETYRRLQLAEIPTIRTQAFVESKGTRQLTWPAVLKPRHGAGSLAMRVVRDASDFERQAAAIRADAAQYPLVFQPYVAGRAISLALVMGPRGVESLLPIGEQRLSNDGRFQYQGGRIPATLGPAEAQAVRKLALDAASCIEGLHGYVGFDLIVPRDGGTPVLVEINPRLTTAYVGYRHLAGENLAARLFAGNGSRTPAPVSDHPKACVEFDSAGAYRLLPYSQSADRLPGPK